MTWTGEEQRAVGTALLGSWPGTITSWGKEAFAAFVGQLEARGLDADAVLRAILAWPAGSPFPPSAPDLAGAARQDPTRPTFDEMLEQLEVCLAARTAVRKGLWRDGERRAADEQAMRDRARGDDVHPSVARFIEAQGGPGRLRSLSLFDRANEYREARRRDLRSAWEEFGQADSERERFALADAGRRRLNAGPSKPDFAAMLGSGQ